jgi:homoserine dehydrogenase
MWTDRIIVLKFGSSILHSDDAANDAVAEIYRHLRRGWRVVAIVSAIGETTDELLDRINRWDDVPGEATATMLATGELASASILAAALRRDGIESRLLTPHQVELRTRGTATDADPVSIRAGAIHAALASAPVAVIPGFLGIGEDGGYTLLGRGGSDLSAVFIARAIAADRCVLIKDVDGLFERDPNAPGQPPRRYDAITWADAMKLDRQIMQPRAVRFGREHAFPFEVAGLNSPRSTRVGHGQTRLVESSATCRRLRVALLGLGAVGRGVFEHLRRTSDAFEIAGVAVRDIERHAQTSISRALLTDDWRELIARDVDVVIELIGGTDVARDAVRESLRRGRHVITANKALIERHGRSLRRLAQTRDVLLRFSAAVGGVTPMLEAVRSIAKFHDISRLEGVLNGTSNFVLDRMERGTSLTDAVAEAQRLGLAEADPTDDLNGADAARKLAILAWATGAASAPLDDVPRDDLRRIEVCDSMQAKHADVRIRQVASCEFDAGEARSSVELSALPRESDLAGLRGEWNALRIEDNTANAWIVRGKGAGRWPTSRAVMADLLDIARPRRCRIPVIASERRIHADDSTAAACVSGNGA